MIMITVMTMADEADSMVPVSSPGEPGARLPLRAWVRRASPSTLTWAFRYEVEEGRAVLRVARPGVLIVPPARSRGHEDQLSADQLRTSVLLYVPNGPGPRRSCSLGRLDDRFLLELDPEVWTELRVELQTGNGQDHILPPLPDEVISLTGEVDPALPTLIDLVDLARLIEKMPTPRLEDDDIEEVIEAGEEGSASTRESEPLRRTDGPRALPRTIPTSRVERQPPPVHSPAAAPAAAPAPTHLPTSLPLPPSAIEPLPTIALAESRDSRHLTRHLRRQLDRKDQELIELRARLQELEQRLSGRR